MVDARHLAATAQVRDRGRMVARDRRRPATSILTPAKLAMSETDPQFEVAAQVRRQPPRSEGRLIDQSSRLHLRTHCRVVGFGRPVGHGRRRAASSTLFLMRDFSENAGPTDRRAASLRVETQKAPRIHRWWIRGAWVFSVCFGAIRGAVAATHSKAAAASRRGFAGNLSANAISGFGLGRILGLAYSCRRGDGNPVLSWLLA